MQTTTISKELNALVNRADRPVGSTLYALVDGALCLSALARAKVFAPTQSIIPADGSVSSADISALPFLIDLTAPSTGYRPRLITELSSWAVEHSAVTWLESDLSMASMAQQLASRMDAQLHENLAVLLRFADARVLPVLYATLDAEQRRSFFSCVTEWWYVSRRVELQALPFERAPGKSSLSFTPPLQLTQAQEQQLIDAAEPDSVMHILCRHDAEALERLAPSERYEFIRSSITRAKGWAIETPSDLAVFCMVALAQGPKFDETPQWTAALTRFREGTTTLIQILQQQAAEA